MERRWEFREPAQDGSIDDAPAAGPRTAWLVLVLVALVIAVGVVYVAGTGGVGDSDDPRVGPTGAGTPSATGEYQPSGGREPSVLPAESTASRRAPGGLAAAPEVSINALKREALEAVERLILDLPNDAEPIALRAMVYDRFGDSSEAVRLWRRALELDPRRPDAHHGLGTAALDKGDNEEAIVHLQRALIVAPEALDVRPALADALMRLGRMEEAVQVLEEQLKLLPRETGSWFRLGQAHFQLKQYEKAKESFEKAIRIDPESTYCYYGLSNTCARLGDKEQSAKYREEFRRLKEKDRDADRERMARLDDAERMRRTVAQMCVFAGSVYFKRGGYTKAEPLWLRAAELDPKDEISRRQLALLYERTNRPERTLAMLEALREIEPENLAYCLNLGVYLARRNRFDAAEKIFREAIRQWPKQAAGYVGLVQLYLRAGARLSEAKALAEKAVELAPIASNYVLLSAACESTGDYAEALAAIEEAAKLEPENPDWAEIRRDVQARSKHAENRDPS
ncbi:MAG: tetratricopeptide repeat protein [Planctomycetota bacterium]|jgi:tetratricopeptide (TPR) repeat protein